MRLRWRRPYPFRIRCSTRSELLHAEDERRLYVSGYRGIFDIDWPSADSLLQLTVYLHLSPRSGGFCETETIVCDSSTKSGVASSRLPTTTKRTAIYLNGEDYYQQNIRTKGRKQYTTESVLKFDVDASAQSQEVKAKEPAGTALKGAIFNCDRFHASILKLAQRAMPWRRRLPPPVPAMDRAEQRHRRAPLSADISRSQSAVTSPLFWSRSIRRRSCWEEAVGLLELKLVPLKNFGPGDISSSSGKMCDYGQ